MEKGMPVERVKIDKATLPQLHDFAVIIFGLEVPEKATKADILSVIDAAGYTQDTIPLLKKSSEIPVLSDANGDPRPRTFMHKFNGGAERECVAITIPEQDTPGGEEPVPVSVNGQQLWIPRNGRQVIPIEYVEALENAEKFIYAPISADTTMQQMEMGLREPRVVKEYPFSYAA